MFLAFPAIAKEHKKPKFKILTEHKRYYYKPYSGDYVWYTENGWEVTEIKEGPDFCIICRVYWDVTFQKVEIDK
jgi:hypothetical protein